MRFFFRKKRVQILRFLSGASAIDVEFQRLHYQNMEIPETYSGLVGGFKHFLFSTLPGEMIQFD